MAVLSANEQTLLEGQYRSEDRLYLVGFPEIWRGKVNDTPARGDQTITYDNGVMQGTHVFGDLSAAEGLMVWFGSNPGEKGIGTARLLSFGAAAASGDIVIEWHDHIELTNNDDITIVGVRPPYPKFSYFTTADGFYKDGPPSSAGGAGIDYSDQNTEPPPDVIMGPPLICYNPTEWSTTYQCTASGSKIMNPSADGTFTYEWAVEPAALGSFSNTAIEAPTFTPAAYGVGFIRLKITDSQSKFAYGWRRVIVENDTAPIHISEFNIGPISQARGKYDIPLSISLTSPDIADTSKGNDLEVDYSDAQAFGEAIISRTETFTNDTLSATSIHSHGSTYTDREGILYCGYITSEQWTINTNGTGRIDLQCNQAGMSMYLYSQSITGISPSRVAEWYQMRGSLMTTEYLAHHLLYYHSTIKEIIDVRLPRDDTVLRGANDEWTEGDLMQRLVASVGSKGRLMDVTSNPNGSLWIDPYLNLQSLTIRTTAENPSNIIMNLDIPHLMGATTINRTFVPQVSQVRAEGFGSPTGVLGDGVPMRSISGNQRLSHGARSQEYRGLVVDTQTTLNFLTGRLLDLANKGVERTYTFSEAFWNVFHASNQRYTEVRLTEAATIRGNLRGEAIGEGGDWFAQVTRVTHNTEPGGIGTVEVTFEDNIDAGLTGRTVAIPTITPLYASNNSLPSGTNAPPTPEDVIAVAVQGTDITKDLDNAAAVDKGDGTVGLPYTSHPFEVGEAITLTGTTNYDGEYLVIASTTNEFTITATYVAETFSSKPWVHTGGFWLYNGSDWERRNSGLRGNADVIHNFHLLPYWWRRALSANPDDSIWYIATSGGLFFTDDGAQTWTDRSPIVTSLPGTKTQDDVIFVDVDSFPDRTQIGKVIWCAANVLNGSTYTAYLFYSSDYGTNWSQGTMTTGARILSISVDKETSTQCWIAWKDENDCFMVGRRSSAFATVGTDEGFGAANNTDIDSGVRKITVKNFFDETVTDYGSKVFVHGIFQK